MTKRKLTEAEREARLERRAGRRKAAADLVQNLRDWHHAREQAAQKARDKAAKKDAKRQRKNPTSRGVDRVPDHLRGLHRTAKPVLVGKRHDIPLAQPEDLHPAGNHAERRARGQRGKTRPRRLREMPGAEARRLERARKEWLAQAEGGAA